MACVEKGAVRCMDSVVRRGGDINSVSRGYTPFLMAVSVRNDRIVKRLLEMGSSIDQKNARGYGPLYIACSRDFGGKDDACLNIISDLVAHGADVNDRITVGVYELTPLAMAVASGSLDKVKKLLELGADISCDINIDGDVYSMGKWAMANGFDKMADFLDEYRVAAEESSLLSDAMPCFSMENKGMKI